MNIRSLENHFDDLMMFIEDQNLNKPSVICLTETWLPDDSTLSLFEIPEYHRLISHAGSNRNSGAGIYVHESLRYQVAEFHESLPAVAVKFTNASKHCFIVACVYNSPSCDKLTFIQKMSTWSSVLANSKHPCYIVGDMNINLLETNTTSNNYIESMLLSGFTQHIAKPTRVTPVSKTLLDLLFHNNILQNTYDVINLSISDHYATKVIIPYCRTKEQKVVTQVKLISFLTDEDSRVLYLRSLNERLLHAPIASDVNDNFSLLTQEINETTVSFTVEKQFVQKENNIPWYSRKIKNQILLRDKYLKQYLANPTSANKLRYTASRNYTICLIKSDFYNRKFESNMKQPRRFYSELNKLSGRNVTKDEVRIIEPEHNVVVREDNLADFFIQRFASQGERVSRTISSISVEKFQSERTLNGMYLYPTSLDEIHHSIVDLKIGKASGIDELSPEVLKISALAIDPYLQKLINQTFSQGEFPDCLKIAKVIPLFKSGSKTDVNNYRSISLLPVLSKVLEKIIYNRLIKFPDRNDILYEKQFGFRSKHSTVDALMEITENIRSGTDEEVTSIMLDLRKAFDTINHYRLLEKLSQCGVREIVNKWFQSYLRNRKQAVFVNNKWSNFEPINCGVPQGSILGPLLFIIYINDFPKCCPNVTTYLFAEDANLIYSKNKSLASCLDKELMNVPSWMSLNKLALNIPKTQMLQFNHTSSVQFMGVNLVNDESAKYLGILIDPKLSFQSHIKHVVKKLEAIVRHSSTETLRT